MRTLIKIGLSVVSGSNILARIESGSLFNVSRVVSNLIILSLNDSLNALKLAYYDNFKNIQGKVTLKKVTNA